MNLSKEVIKPYIVSFIGTFQLHKSFKDRFIEVIVRILSLLIFPIIYLLLYIIEPFKKIRIGFLYNRRLGHLILNTDLFLRQKQLGLIDEDVYYLFFAYKPANEQVVKMFQRNMNIINSEWISKLVSPIGFFRTRFWQPLPFNSNEHYEFNKADRTLFFTDEEETLGKKELAKMGIGKDDWYVCIFARDEAYADALFSNMNHSSTNHRNGDIDSYISAAQYIVEQGGFVIRMGYKVAKEFGYNHPKVIDYAIDHRSDFMDIYLPANCFFYLGTSNGAADLARIFDKPQASVNYMSIGSAPIGKNEIFIPKNIKYIDSEEYVPFDEQIKIFKDIMISFGHTPDDKLKDYGMELVNDTPDQVLQLVKEMFSRLNGTWINNEEYAKKLEEYNQILINHEHWCSNFKQVIGKNFLMNMKLYND